MEVKRDDYVYRKPDNDEWEVKITIPGLDGLVVVETKRDLTLDEMIEYDTSEFSPEKALINFYVMTTQPPITPVILFQHKMILEIRGNDRNLGYLDLCKEKWIKFKDQGKENGITWAKIKDWAADPQIAWGF